LNGNVNHTFVGKFGTEDTMAKYNRDTKKTPVPFWGCGSSDHSFANCTTILCPNNKDKPGVMDKAAKARKEFNEKLSGRKKAKAQDCYPN
jgi:hypothetical protein